MRRSGPISALSRDGVPLDRDRAGDRVDHRAELGNRAVTHELDDAATMLGEPWLDHFAAQGFDRFESRGFVLLDQAGIADDVGGENCRQPPFDARNRHRKRLFTYPRRFYARL
jgi:hypothetical protein